MTLKSRNEGMRVLGERICGEHLFGESCAVSLTLLFTPLPSNLGPLPGALQVARGLDGTQGLNQRGERRSG